MRNYINGHLLLLVAALLLSVNARAADPLQLDSGFGLGGRVATNFGDADVATALALQANGRIVAAGHSFLQGSLAFALSRYHASGQLDNSFSNDGRVRTDFGGEDQGHAVVVQTDGKIIVAGGSDLGPQGARVALARYHPGGLLDTSFGNNGLVLTVVDDLNYAYAMALQADGRIVIAGQAAALGGSSDFLVVRYLQNGSLDPSFGTGGVVITDFGGRWDIARSVAVLNNGRIVVAGSSWGDGFTPSYGALARYLPNGSLDISLHQDLPLLCQFGNSCGKVVVDLGGGAYDWIRSMSVRRPNGTEDGKMIVSGEFGVARLTASGVLDGLFSGDGINASVTTNGDAVALRDDGRIVAVGTTAGDFGITLYGFNGEVDNKCSISPSTSVDLNGGFDSAYAVAIQPDTRIVLAGAGEVFDLNDFALARLLGGGCNLAAVLKNARYWVAYHKFVHPQDKVGPTWPGIVPPGLVRSTQVVVPSLETAETGPYAYKNYAFGKVAVERDAIADTNETERAQRHLSTSIGDFVIDIGRLDHAMLAAAAQAPKVRLDIAQTDATAGYECRIAKSPIAGKLGLRDPLNPNGRIRIDNVTHFCEAWDNTERTEAEPSALLCFSARGIAKRNGEIYVRDTLGAQYAELGAVESVCITAVDQERLRTR